MTFLGKRLFGASVVVALAVTAVFALWVSPRDAQQGDAVRLLYLHVPSAWIAYLAFLVTAVASVLWLVPRTRATTWDLLAGASAEVGVVFTGLTLAMGSIWGKPIWGSWWEWDARLTTTAVLFFLYLGYLALRRVPDDTEVRSKRCAIAALAAFVGVPIVHLSVEWWRTLHQGRSLASLKPGSTLDGDFIAAMLLGFVAMTLTYLWLLALRTKVIEADNELEEHALTAAIAARRREAVAQ